MRLALLLPVLLTAGCWQVDAIDQSAADCTRIMGPRVLTKANTMPGDNVLSARSAEIEYVFYGGKRRLERLLTNLPPGPWKGAKVEPRDEVNYGLVLVEDAVGYKKRAKARIDELCRFAETNRIQLRYWWLNASGIADFTSQRSPVEPWG